jgi:glycosyltransferase involved in cell wall biosynthesis
LVKALAEVDRQNHYTLYFNHIPAIPPVTHANFSSKSIPMPRFWTQARLALEMVTNPPDLLFVPAHTLPIIRSRKLKTVVTIHDLGVEYLKEYHQFPHKLYLNKTTVYASRQADGIIAVSESTKKDLVEKLGTDPAKIAVIYEGFDPTHFYPRNDREVKRIKDKINVSGDYVLFVGTIQPRKNLKRLIEAFALWKKGQRKKDLKDLKLIIAGKKGWLYEEILDTPARLNIDDQVKFVGHILDSDLPALYTGARAFLFPSLYEGFGLPVLEAFATKTPVLTSKVSSLPEVAGNAGLLVDPKSTEAIADGIDKLLTSEYHREEFIARSQDQLKKFSWKKTAEQTVAFLEKVGRQGERS